MHKWQSQGPAQSKGNDPGPAQKWQGLGPAQSKGQTYGDHVPGAKVAGLRHCLVPMWDRRAVECGGPT